MSRIFLTGGSGFLGSRLIRTLARSGITVVGLDRSGRLGAEKLPGAAIEVVRGNVLDPRTYREALASTQTVVHMAAATGRASADEHFEINFRGTKVLLEQCRQAGVEKFLFVSSIAVKFPEKSLYYYAQAKQLAEEAVQGSGLDFTIVRPTIILGRGSGPQAALSKLARLPVIPVFGKGRARVQPVFVEDLVAFIVEILEKQLSHGRTLELGGPTVLTIEDLLLEIRRAANTPMARTVHIPLRPLLALLGIAERMGVRGLPLSAGQLSSFRFDGTSEPSALHESRRATLKTVPEMLSLSLAA